MKEFGSRKRKRATISSSPDSGDDSKPRGRPRVEKQDASAADRRRTQIRMAQRAYRQRKESTLDKLRQRVSELTNTVELMNKAFAECADQMLGFPGSSTAALHVLRETLDQFDAWTSAARNASEEGLLDDALTVKRGVTEHVYHDGPAPKVGREAPVERTPTESPSREEGIVEIRNVSTWLDRTALLERPKPTSSAEIGLGYTMYLQDVQQVSQAIDHYDYDRPQPFVLTEVTEEVTDAYGDGQDPASSTAHPPDDIHIPSELTPPVTYSFQETSFARRLHRATLEAGYYLVLDPTRDPQSLEKVFKLSLMGRDRAKIAASLKVVLSRGSNEPLDLWEAPLIHIGGAGTHYPRPDADGSLLPRRRSFNLGLTGPQTLALLPNAARDNVSTDMTVEIAGFEGEWFDPCDVEGYLEEKGIRIHPGLSFVEVEVVEWPGSPSTMETATSSTTPATPHRDSIAPEPVQTIDTEQPPELEASACDTINWNNLTNTVFTDVGYSDKLTSDWMNFIEPGQGIAGLEKHTQTTWDESDQMGLMPPAATSPPIDTASQMPLETLPSNAAVVGPTDVPLPRKKSVIIDVSKLVNTLVPYGICLGRAPGFRRQHVDRALAMATFNV